MNNCGHLVLSVLIAYIVEADTAGSSQHDGLALLFLRNLFKFHQSFGRCEYADESWCQSGQVTGRPLYTEYQLQESGHSTKGDAAVAESE